MHIVLLKSVKESQDDPYAKALQDDGHTVSLVETLDFVFHHEELKKISNDINNWASIFSAVIFTSPRAVQAFKLSGLSVSKDILCFVVGNATKTVAESIGFITKGAETGSADNLLDFIVNYDRSILNKPLLFPCGKMHRPVLPTKLEEAGLQVKSVVVYSTKECLELSDRLIHVFNTSQTPPNLIVFFSPSGVAFSEKTIKDHILPKHPNLKFGSMGGATSAQLKAFGFPVVMESRSPMPAAMAKAISGI